LQASSAETTLQLKRNFVRYISHELRSPLNVAYAGLEYVRQVLVDQSCRPEVLELIDEVFVANECAIAILDNLLNYESIDAGQFSLAFAWKPLHLFLGNYQALPLVVLYVTFDVFYSQEIEAFNITGFEIGCGSEGSR